MPRDVFDDQRHVRTDALAYRKSLKVGYMFISGSVLTFSQLLTQPGKPDHG